MQSLALADTLGSPSADADPASLDRRMVFAAVAQQLLGGGAPPVTIGRFVLIERVGTGSFGTVYSAFDPRLQRRIALKLVDGLGGDDDVRSRVEREAQVAAGLAHPNVVTVHDVGEVDGRVYIAMEFVEGTTLRAWCREAARDWRTTVQMFVEVAAGLQAAHDAGIVHRDFKPDNVLIGTDGRPRIADFGLARALARGDATQTIDGFARGTDEGTTSGGMGGIAGTPAYMAPEQFAGRGVGPASDQFAFCVALYEAVCGQRPFAGTDMASIAAEVIAGNIRPLRASLPRRLVAAIRRGLAVEPSRRHPSMSALTQELRRGLGRRRRVATGVVALFVAGASTAVGARIASPPDPCARVDTSLEDHWPTDRREAYAARAADDPDWNEVIEKVDRYAQTWRAGRIDACERALVHHDQSPIVRELRDSCLERRLVGFGALLSGFDDGLPPSRGAPLIDEGQARLAYCDDPETLLRREENRFARETDRTRDVRADVLWNEASAELERARVLRALGRAAEVQATTASVAEKAREVGLRWMEAEALAIGAAADLDAGALQDAVQRAERAIELAVAVGHHATAFDALVTRVHLSLARGAVSTSDDVRLQLAGALLERIGEDPLRQVDLLEVRGLVARATGDPEAAGEWLEQAVAAADTAYAPHHASSITARNNLASVALESGDLNRAHALWTSVLTDAAAGIGEQHPITIASAFNLGAVELERNRPAEAAAYFAMARQRWTASVGPMHPWIALALGAQGDAMRKLGRHAQSRMLQTEALVLRERMLGPDHPEVAQSLEELATLDRIDRDFASAHARIGRALAIRTAAQGDDHADLAVGLAILAELLCDEGRAAEAIAPIERALLLRAKSGLDPAGSIELHPIAVRALVASARGQ